MKLTESQVAKLEHFLDSIKSATYPEPASDLHDTITAKMLDALWSRCTLPPKARVLDVGCGQGVALKHFVSRGLDPVGITLNSVDVAECQKRGYNVLEMDQSFLEFPDAHFDLIWCRHCLEHSIFPYFTLSEFFRVTRPGGWVYIEVPAPDTSCHHETNKNHYSTLGKSLHANLMQRAGFRLLDVVDINFSVTLGPDQYWAFFLQRP